MKKKIDPDSEVAGTEIRYGTIHNGRSGCYSAVDPLRDRERFSL